MRIKFPKGAIEIKKETDDSTHIEKGGKEGTIFPSVDKNIISQLNHKPIMFIFGDYVLTNIHGKYYIVQLTLLEDDSIS